MYYKVDIFFRNIHHLSDGRFAAGIWAKWASFNFDNASKDYISPVQASEIINWMSGPAIVAEFGKNNTTENILATTKLLSIKTIAIPASLLSTELKEHFDSIFVVHEETNEIIPGKKGHYELENAIHNAIESKEGATDILNSKKEVICINGIHEEKPGTADYEELSIFMEYLED